MMIPAAFNIRRLMLGLCRCSPFIDTIAEGAIRTRTVEYRQGEAVLEGILSWDDDVPEPRPAVLVVPQWKWIADFERTRSDMLARLAYAAGAANIHGKGIRADNP